MKYSDVFYTMPDGEEFCVEDMALGQLLLADSLFVIPAKEGGISIAVNCNDLFFWACAELEPLPFDEIGRLYKMCFDENGKEKPYGAVRWACLKRGMRPQHGWIYLMKDADVWDEELEALPEREANVANPDYNPLEKKK